MIEKFDFLISGAGIVGTAISMQLRNKFPEAKILVIDKEKTPGAHGSGRNSGVLHAGFYYTPDSLKAKFTREGNEFLADYCETKKLRINKCGKLVVARDEEDLAQMDVLFERGKINKVDIHEIDASEAKKLEPLAKTYKKALYSPKTYSVDPVEVLISLQKEAEISKIIFRYSEKFLNFRNGLVETDQGKYDVGHFINASGLQADLIARKFGFSKNYEVLPFKGLYLYSDELPSPFRMHIYPVPDLRNPFLGVHVTMTVDGKAKLGPTAIPGFWRENYNYFESFSLPEFLNITMKQLNLFFTANFPFRELALEEIKKHSKHYMVKKAGDLAEEIRYEKFTKWGKPGIRAQLVDTVEKKLVSDFLIEGDSKSTHILNAVSPAFTGSFPFAGYAVGKMQI